MNSLKIGSLLVEEQGNIVGILTSRDVRVSHPNRIAADAMTANLVSVTTDCFVWDALDMMKEYGVERLVIVENERVRGMITREMANICMSRFIDPLTALYRADYIRYMTEHFLEQRQPFHFLFVDLDDFGKINKVYGRRAGDDLLQRFSNRLRDLQREHMDYIRRYAGDEFIFLTLRDRAETEYLIERISARSSYTARKCMRRSERFGQTTVRIPDAFFSRNIEKSQPQLFP